MSTRAPATRAGASPAGDAPATIVTEPRFARPFRGAAAAASLGMDAGCQTEPLPQLEPLRPLRDRETDDAGKPPSDAARAEADERVGAGEEALARRRRRSSSVERDDAAREIERISAADLGTMCSSGSYSSASSSSAIAFSISLRLARDAVMRTGRIASELGLR